MSVESGIPDFRGPCGIWQKYPPEEYATIDAYRADPDKVWKFWIDLGNELGDWLPSFHKNRRWRWCHNKTHSLQCSHQMHNTMDSTGHILEIDNEGNAVDDLPHDVAGTPVLRQEPGGLNLELRRPDALDTLEWIRHPRPSGPVVVEPAVAVDHDVDARLVLHCDVGGEAVEVLLAVVVA